ncbi:MAG TPA: hypothetical protein VKE22_21115 [Haliangiales bacterium]|nr:hypothetical protein [Haliangiales bacterium]
MRRHLTLILLAACVRENSLGPAPECTTSKDCRSGLECMVGLCYGDPPKLDFAAVLVPPDDRSDLTVTDIQSMSIAKDGEASLAFGAPVPVTGRVVLKAGDAASVAARVYFNRALRIPGADPYSVEVTAQAGKQPGEIGFRAMVAPNVPGEAYDVVVLPDDGTIQSAPAGETPAALAPPLKTRLEVTGQMRVDLALQDAAGLKTIGGRVVDAASRGMPGISVTAWGRRTPASPMELASSQATTAIDGSFVVYVPVSWDDTFDVLCAPGTLHAPTLRRRGVVVLDGAYALPALLLRYPSYPRAVRYELPVLGPDNAGGNRAADGAKVTLRTPLGATAGDEVTYETQATADSAGIAAVWLIPGSIDLNRTYGVDVLPLPNAPHAAAWNQTVVVGPPNASTGDGGVLADLELGRRAYVTGLVKDARGVPVENLLVVPQLSPFFTNATTPDVRARAWTIGLPQNVTTDRGGHFALYLDPSVAGATAFYDLDLVPPSGSRDPRWSHDRVMPPANGDGLNLGDLALPRSSLAYAIVKDSTGQPVADAEVRVYVRSQDPTVCNGAPAGCVPPARLRVLAKTNSDGFVTLVLPSP